MITVINIANAVYKSADGDIIDVDITTKEHGVMQTTVMLSKNENLPHILQIKEWLAVNPIAPFVPVAVTQAQLNDRKDAQVDAELGTDTVRLIVETILPHINPALKAADIIAEAKMKRRAEL